MQESTGRVKAAPKEQPALKWTQCVQHMCHWALIWWDLGGRVSSELRGSVDMGTPTVVPAWSARKMRMDHLDYGDSLGWEMELSCFCARKVGFCSLFFYHIQLNIAF